MRAGTGSAWPHPPCGNRDGQSIFVDPERKLVMVVTAAARNASVGKELFAAERSALWRGLVGKYGSW